MKLTIAIIDRHAITRIGISQAIHNDFQDVHIVTAADIDSFVRAAHDQVPELIIMDLGQHSDQRGVAKVREMLYWFRGAKVLAYDGDINFLRLRQYLKAGVDGYLYKESHASELITAMKQVLAGARYVCNKGFEMILNDVRPEKSPQAAGQLTAAEFEVARCMSEGLDMTGIAKRLRSNAAVVRRIQSSVFLKMESVGKP